jgi:curved DNA-binding protein CbpA
MTRLPRDPHAILGVARDADRRQIKAAYRRLAKQFHPDRNPADPNAEEQFKEIQWAYEEVLNPRQSRTFEGTVVDDRFPGDGSHPFFSFFAAMKAHYDKQKKN